MKGTQFAIEWLFICTIIPILLLFCLTFLPSIIQRKLYAAISGEPGLPTHMYNLEGYVKISPKMHDFSNFVGAFFFLLEDKNVFLVKFEKYGKIY